MRRRRPVGDGGFTLVELLITIVIMGIITVPLANFVLSYFINTATATGRLSESHDEQIAATYFAGDVANVGMRDASLNLQRSVWLGSFPAGSCGASASAADQLLLLKWDNATYSAGTETKRVDSVAYVRAVTAGETQLHRVYCRGTTQVSDVVVVHNLDPGVAPAVTCSSTCQADAVPATINLQLGIAVASGKSQPFTMTLTGQRRQS